MKKNKATKIQLQLKQYPVAEVSTHITFYAIRLTFYTIVRGLTFGISIVSIRGVIGANNIIINYAFSLFLLFSVLYSVLTENIYGYFLSVVVMVHNFLLTMVMLTLISLDIKIKVRYWFIGLGIASSYIIEAFFALFYIHKRQYESNKALFQKIGADKKINEIYSTRQKLRTLNLLNMFIPLITVKTLFLPPSAYRLHFDYISVGILILTGVQHILVYTRFHDENLTQRKIAMAITVAKAVLAVALAISASIRFLAIISKVRVVRIIIYMDLLLISLVFLYYLWMDMRNFGKGLKKHILFRTRELTL